MLHTKLKIALATLMVLFNLAVCFVGTWAWFAASTTNGASSMQVKIYTHELDMSYRVYKYDDDLKEVVDATAFDDPLTLSKYDSVITSRNANTPIILEFMLTGMDLEDNLPVHISTHCENDTSTANVLSNIIKLQFAAIDLSQSATATDIYRRSVQYFADNSVPEMKFKNGVDKVCDVVYDLTDYESLLLDGMLRLYVKLDYSAELVADFPVDIMHDADSTTFSNDLTLIECYTDEN